MKNELIHTSIITLDFTTIDKPPAPQPREYISIEDSLNRVLSDLTHSLLSANPDERKQIEKRIDEVVSILERRHW